LVGSALSAVGSQMTTFAVALQVYTLTHSSVAVGAVGLAAAAPAIALGLIGGSLVDAVDRRVLVLVTSSCLALVSAAFAAQAFADLGQLWPLYLLVALQSLLNALNNPARRTFMPRLLRADQVAVGSALNMLALYCGVIAGPALAGVVAAAWGLKVCYLIDAVSFGAALYGVARLPAMPPQAGGARPGLRSVGAGLRFIRGNRIVTGAFLADLSATVLGMPIALFPAINAERFGGSAQTLGFLSAAVAVGGVLGTAFSGPVGQVTRQGRAMLIAGVVWGAGLVGFGLAHSLWLTLLMLAIAGAADVTSVVFRTAMVQLATPDGYRGRVSAAEYIIGAACPQLGNFRAGAIGSLTSPSVSAVSGGLSTIVGAAIISLALPTFVRYQAFSTAAVDRSGKQATPITDEG
jgi:MFS family permease